MAENNWEEDIAALRRAVVRDDISYTKPDGPPVRFVHILASLALGIGCILAIRFLLSLPDEPSREGLRWFAGNVLPLGVLVGFGGAVLGFVSWLFNRLFS